MRFKSDIEFEDINCPIKPPRIVREFGNVFVLISILFLPTACVGAALAAKVTPTRFQSIVGTTVLVACLLGWLWLPLHIGSRKASRWLLAVINHFLEVGNPEEATRIARRYARAIRFDDFRDALWFQAFLNENAVRDQWGIFESYLGRLRIAEP